MAEYVADFDNVETLARFQMTTRLRLERDLVTHNNKQWKVKKNIWFLCRFLFIMLSDTYNNNLKKIEVIL